MTLEKIHTLIIKFLDEDISEKEMEELSAWLAQDEDNIRTFRSLKDVYDLGRFETDTKSANTATEWKKLFRRIGLSTTSPTYRQIKPFRKIMRYAAIFIFGLICMQTVNMLRKEKPKLTDKFVVRIETGKSERSKILLPDSSTVWLNACSSISYDQNFGDQARNVYLKGEAYFNVREDVSKPFLVHVDSIICRVTGTSFNMYSFENDNKTSLVLVEGHVTLEYGSFVAKVMSGELIEFDKTDHKIYRKKINPDFYTGWRFGELAFEKMPFEELAKRLERNFNVTFKIQNAKVKKESFGGTFRHYDSLETILKVISTGTHIKYHIEKDTVYIR